MKHRVVRIGVKILLRVTAYGIAVGAAAVLVTWIGSQGVEMELAHPLLGLLAGPALEEGLEAAMDNLRDRLQRRIPRLDG